MSITYPSIQIQLANDQFVEFGRADIVDAQVVEEFNAVAVETPISTLEFTVIDTDGKLSMFSGQLFEQLVERLPVFCYQFADEEFRLIGKFYLDTWKNLTTNKVEFTAVSILGVLADTDFDGIFWSENKTLPSAMTDVFSGINIAYDIHEDLQDVTISGWIPPGNYREALQQICFAAGAMAVTARQERLQIVPSRFPIGAFDAKINETQAEQKSIELLPLVSSIELVSHNYTQSLTSETIFDQTLAAGDHKVVFDKPYFDIVIDGIGYVPRVLATEGGDYLVTENEDYIEAGGEFAFGTNSVYFRLGEEAHITITGTPWVDSKRSFMFEESGITSTKNKRTINVANATLVNIERAQAILDRMRDYYRQRYVQVIKLQPGPLKTSDIILSNTFEKKKILSSIRKMELQLSGGFWSNAELRGYLPNYVLPIANPVRRPRTGLAVCNGQLTLDSRWRKYA